MTRRAAIDGLELEYEVTGEGPDLVWLHGLGGNLEDGRLVAETLGEHFRVLWYSCRGCGRSSPLLDPTRYGYGRIAADLDALLDVVGFDKPLLVGGSHGANTILRHTADFPGRALGLLLIAPGANALSRPTRLRFALAIQLPLLLARLQGPDGLVRILSGKRPDDPQANPFTVAALRTHDPASVRVAMRRIPDQRAVDPAALADFAVPTHVAAWDRDPIIHPIAVARRIAELVPGATFEEIERAPDMPPEEVARRVSEITVAWSRPLLDPSTGGR
jgi:3-oxoadipate enol-lactonase